MNGVPKRKVAPEPVSYFTYGEGSFIEKKKEATVVSAFYDIDIPSGLSLDTRKANFRAFLENCDCKLVLFTSSDLADELASYREGYEERTRVIVLGTDAWTAVTKFKPRLWEDQVKQNPDYRNSHVAEEFQFGFEKKEFVLKAIEMNPFSSDDFVWVDPNLFVEKKLMSYFSSFPNADEIPTDRILVLNLEPFKADDFAVSSLKGKPRVNNLVLAGSANAWKEFSKLYDLIFAQKLRVFAFVGDDIAILSSMILHKSNQFCLVKPVSTEIEVDRQYSLFLILSHLPKNSSSA